MKHVSALFVGFALATLTLVSCRSETDVNTGTDTTARIDTVGSTAPAYDTTAAKTDSVGSAVGNAGTEVKTESVEKLVEAQLMISPGYSNVKVESEGNGVIILKGTAATAEEKAGAEAEARKVAGVKEIKNEIEVKK